MSSKKRIGATSTYVTEVNKIMKIQVNDSTEYLFRGQASTEYELIPSIARNANFLLHERDLISSAKNKQPDVFTNALLPLETLALLQHYGIPTRLLDVTESALVALYFACQPTGDKKSSDGVVYVFKNESKRVANHAILNTVADSAYILNYNDKETVPLEKFFNAMMDQPYWKKTTARYNQHANSGSHYVEKHLKGTLFVNAPTLTLRQQIQQGKYILFPNDIIECITEENTVEKCFAKTVSPIREDNATIAGKIIIAKQYKKSILRELKTLGVTEESLFSDSIDKVCAGIKNNFL